MNPILCVFLDGVGIGEKDKEKNPFFELGFKTFKNIFGEIPSIDNPYLSTRSGIYLFPTDANLGVPGFPQSGTGQVSLFCGINAPELIGKHFGPFPPHALQSVIREKNIFFEILKRGEKALFANAFPKIFFEYLKAGKRRLSFTTLSCLMSGIPIKTVTDLRKGKALSAEITNQRWVEKLNYNLPVIKPETGARRLIKIASENKFTLFEFFLTDHLGHGRLKESFTEIWNSVDLFLYSVLSSLPRKMTLIICSDHGNLEDISLKSHTNNPALTLTAGYKAKELSRRIKTICDIKPALLDNV